MELTMLGDLFDSPWKLLIVAAVLIVLFGGKKMPDAARSLGRSMRILKSEVHDLHGDHDHDYETAEAPRPVPAVLSPPQQQIDELQRQIRDLQRKQPAGQPVTAGGAPAADPPQTQRLS
jgi:sec-independent protein translocase protein TatA